MKGNIEITVIKINKQIVCKECGFITYAPLDMVLHLAQEQKHKEENCMRKSLVLLKEK